MPGRHSIEIQQEQQCVDQTQREERDFNGSYSLTLIFYCNLLSLVVINNDKFGLDFEFMRGYRASVLKDKKLKNSRN